MALRGLDKSKPAVVKPIRTKTISSPAVGKAKDGQAYRAVSVRFTEKHYQMLEEVMNIRECDRSEAVRLGVRHDFIALTAHDARLILTDVDGKTTEIPLKKDGVPI